VRTYIFSMRQKSSQGRSVKGEQCIIIIISSISFVSIIIIREREREREWGGGKQQEGRGVRYRSGQAVWESRGLLVLGVGARGVLGWHFLGTANYRSIPPPAPPLRSLPRLRAHRPRGPEAVAAAACSASRCSASASTSSISWPAWIPSFRSSTSAW